MSNQYPVPAKETRTEIEVKKSRFIATLAPVSSVADARAFVARVKAEFSDAAHNVPAFLVGFGPSVTAHCSDDGEPSGTAGRPLLAVLQGSGLGDVAVVVTRYFGGIKLGTGGLVRAYSRAVQAVLADTPRAVRVSTHLVKVSFPYRFVAQIRRLVEKHDGIVRDEVFAADVTVTAQFVVETFANFEKELQEMSHGSLTAEIVKTNEATIVPFVNRAK